MHMKKTYLLLMAAFLLGNAQPSVAQDAQPQRAKTEKSSKKEKTAKKQAQEKLPPLVSENDAVDLGLSVRWAPFNVGATRPEEYGDYFAWGETQTKTLYRPDTYRYYSKSSGMMDIGKVISGKRYDAASVLWRGTWRIPTKEECRELIDRCKWTHTKQNGVVGMLVTGPNGNSIFLPSGGYRQENVKSAEQVRGHYWTGNLVQYDSGNFNKENALQMDFVDGKGGLHESYRFRGNMVRAVTDAPVATASATPTPAPTPTPVPTSKPASGSTSASAAQTAVRGELGIFELRGPVKSCTWVNEWGNTIRTFDAQGFWKTIDGKSLSVIYPSGIRRDAKGRIVKGLVDSDGNGEDYTYDALGRVVKSFGHIYDDINTETTRYGADGYVLQRHFEPGGMDAGEPYTETYKNTAVDQHGNWTERKVYSTDGSITVQKRKITYY